VSNELEGVHIFASALVPIGLDRPAHPEDFPWCDKCFPVLPDGLRVNFDYMLLVTGMTRAELEQKRREFEGDDSLVGLA